MHIVHISSEIAPSAKVGGLGDVVHGLCKELVRCGHQVDIILPKYDCIHYDQLKNLKVYFRELVSFEGAYKFHNTIWSAEIDGLKVFLIEPHHPAYYFSRGRVYGEKDDVERFTYFSRTAMEFLYKSGQRPDILHVHDWPTALAAPLYKDMYIPLGLHVGAVVFTIHNLQHQGKCSPIHLYRAGLKGDLYLTPEKMQDPTSLVEINLLKGGIVYSDAITTVSPTYEKEIMTLEGGHGLQDILIKNQKKMHGILNGIDINYWNPAADPHLIAHYSTDAPIDDAKVSAIVAAKQENKKQLRTHLRLKEIDTPLCAAVTRLAPQKGPHLIAYAVEKTLEQGCQFVLLGSHASPELERDFLKLKAQYEKTGLVAICLDQDEALAHQIYAAADMLIIPSLFEPCGLTQMISLRYGTVPLVRKTGGLADTVFDIENVNIPDDKRNGFTFDFPDQNGVDWALQRAISCWEKNHLLWRKLIKNGTNADYSWLASAEKYLNLYRSLLKLPEKIPVKKKKIQVDPENIIAKTA